MLKYATLVSSARGGCYVTTKLKRFGSVAPRVSLADESFAGRLGRMGLSRREVPRTHSEELIQVNHAVALQVYSAAL